MNIKSLHPRRNGRYQQGYVDPSSCKKLLPGAPTPVIYRSSYERRFIQWLERSSQVRWWASECIAIPYKYPDGSTHLYYPDYFLIFSDGSKVLVEVKPKNQTIPPPSTDVWRTKEWSKNNRKWSAAMEYCSNRGIEFKILTEETINRL